jgi:hypothetical protein
MSVEDDERLERPSTNKTTGCWKIWELIHKDTEDTVGISYGVCQFLTENFNMHHIATKFAPRLLTNDQKQQCVNMCLELWDKANKPRVISLFFPNWKRNWRDDILKECWTSKGNHKRYSTALRKIWWDHCIQSHWAKSG